MNASILSAIIQNTSSSSRVTPAENAKLKSACEDFQSVFFGMVLKEMRKTVPEDPLLGDDGHAQEIFQGMMDDEVAKQMAKQNGSDSLVTEMYNQLAKRLGGSTEATPSDVATNED